jgi:uncharacterized protein YbjT (DUF2867 family)
MKTAVIAGSTGLVGSELLRKLLDSPLYGSVLALTRRDFPLSHPKLEKIITDFLHPELALTGKMPDDVFCCLGTTMAKAKTREKFREVDFAYPLSLATATHAIGAKQYLLVSALGASRRSSVYYNHVKGEVEEAVAAVGFRTLHIFRPSLLLGPRGEKRPGEEAAKTFFRWFGFIVPKKYRAIEAGTVAQAMLTCASMEQQGIFIHESNQIPGVIERKSIL